MCLRTEKGQATVEAAFGIPVLFMLLLMLIQPGIVLYDYMIMRQAAAEGCRLLATKTQAAALPEDRYVELIKRQLGAIPPHSLFHIHEPICSWDIVLTGDETSKQVSVAIRNRLKLLPLFDAGGSLLGVADADGCIAIEVSESAQTQPLWVQESQAGLVPEEWTQQRKGG